MVPRCRAIADLATDYLEDALDPRARGVFAEHVAGCEDCATILDQLQATVALLGSLGPEPVAAAARAQALATFRAWRPTA